MRSGQLIKILVATAAIALPASAMAQKTDLQKAQEEAAAISKTKMEIRQEVKRDVLPSLRDVLIAPSTERRVREEKGLPRPRPYTGVPQPEVVDTVLQSSISAPAAPGKTGGPLAPVATVGVNVDGVGQGFNAFTVNSAPPDTHGAVGTTQYVQIVNSSFAVFGKATGTRVMGASANRSLWVGFGGKCESANDGDPIVNFDAAAQRWVITQFAVTPTAAPFFECVAVSQTADATGAYNRYAFSYNDFPDYPKFAVHPDAYYFTFNVFNAALTAFVGSRACAYDRAAMLAGLPATQQCFTLPATGDFGLLPSDPDGSSPVAAGSPNYMLALRSSTSLGLYKFKANFANPALTTFTGPTVITVAAYTQQCSATGTCIRQPSPGGNLDGLGDRMMSRLSYRLYPDGHEALVANHSISTGVRWYEIRNPGAAAPVIFQQGTYAPAAGTRWMGAMAQDKNGNFLLGYSIANRNPAVRPSLRVAARAPTDAAGTLGVENNVITGTGVQTGGLSRWGDYSSMTVDPVDNCTFWFTSEYLKANGSFNWNTRIASIKLAGCN